MMKIVTPRDSSSIHNFKNLIRVISLLVMISFLTGCFSLSHKIVSLDESDAENPTKVASISVETKNPLLIHGIDGTLLESVKLQSAFRTWSFVVAPGKHILWLSGTPYGHPLLPQRHRCYSMEVFLSPGLEYVLKEIPGEKRAMLLAQPGGEIVATGKLVDNPWVFDRGCHWK